MFLFVKDILEGVSHGALFEAKQSSQNSGNDKLVARFLGRQKSQELSVKF